MKRVEFRMERRHGPGSLERLAAMLNRAMEGPEAGNEALEWELAGEEGFIRFQFPLGPGPAAKKKACERVGRVLAEFTLTEHEPQMLKRYFSRKYGVDDPIEVDLLIAETVLLLDGEPDADSSWSGRGRERRLRKLTERFAAYLAGHDALHVDGFVRFRLGDYETEVLEAAETALEEKRMEQQYEEFMSLLKSLVDWQQTGIPAVHVLHAGGHAFRLLDEDMRPLERDGLSADDVETDEEESILVSRLLAVSPGRLHIHTPEPDSQVIRTLIGIFGDRAALHPHHP
ncbi:putative sporulation protein YtxC [Cohnella caldifontis]|uniref:putative sporulation protein YtxC n=1 Tax=Cohnella caldifontis TaxID=3027471 RepID=UPI0023ED6028|nr:putative sporulation protein YtxC [Cohnella sp. YIM B05605]